MITDELHLRIKTLVEDFLNLDEQSVESFVEFATICYQRSKESGWWTNLETGERLNRDKGEMLALVHSELSEALEGVRKNLKDDHLKDRPMLEVELADTLIRLGDFVVGWHIPIGPALLSAFDETVPYSKSLTGRIADCHVGVSMAHVVLNTVDDPDYMAAAVAEALADTLVRLAHLSDSAGCDLAGATADKIRYNANRADHKIENRLKADGKKF